MASTATGWLVQKTTARTSPRARQEAGGTFRRVERSSRSPLELPGSQAWFMPLSGGRPDRDHTRSRRLLWHTSKGVLRAVPLLFSRVALPSEIEVMRSHFGLVVTTVDQVDGFVLTKGKQQTLQLAVVHEGDVPPTPSPLDPTSRRVGLFEARADARQKQERRRRVKWFLWRRNCSPNRDRPSRPIAARESGLAASLRIA